MVASRTLNPNGFTARAKRPRRGNHADNEEAASHPVKPTRQRRTRIHSVFLSGPALNEDLAKESTAFRKHFPTSAYVQICLSSAMTWNRVSYFNHQHDTSGPFMRLIFRTESQARRGLELLVGDGISEGIIPKSGKDIQAHPCTSVCFTLGIEKCLCSSRKLKAEIEDLGSAFGGLKVESSDEVMEENTEMVNVVDEFQGWNVQMEEEHVGDSEMIL